MFAFPSFIRRSGFLLMLLLLDTPLAPGHAAETGSDVAADSASRTGNATRTDQATERESAETADAAMPKPAGPLPESAASEPVEHDALDGDALFRRVAAASVEILSNGQLAGSGWFASADGLVVTARHVIRALPGNPRLEVLLSDGSRFPVEEIATAPGHDLALLQLTMDEDPDSRRAFPFLPVAERFPPPTEPVYLFGQMVFRHGLLLAGKVAGIRPAFEYLPGQKSYVRINYVAPALPIGTSGGPWVDRHGRVVGNQVGTVSLGNSPVGMSFVAELSGIRRLLKEKTTIDVATLGMSATELWEHGPNFVGQFPQGTSGLVPGIHDKEGPAAAAGLTDKMVITAVDGRAVAYRRQLLARVREKQPGESLMLTVLEAGNAEPRELKVTLGRLAE